jgi:type VI secretion system FHA domain protein
MHLLVPHGRGFMPPVTAVKDAYNDLRSHQFGMMAGMRGALTSVLERFDPAHLEKRLTRKRGLGSSILSSRKAKLWELYEDLHSEISREAEDDFQALFGREFLKAYEAQIRKLEQEDTDS